MEKYGNNALQFSLPHQLVASKCDEDGSEATADLSSIVSATARAFVSVAEIIGKFGGADQLSNAVNQFQSLLYAA